MSDRYSWILNTAHKKEIFHWRFSQRVWPNLQFPEDSVTFTEEILNRKPEATWNLKLQRRIQNPGKHLKWSVLWEQLTAESRQPFPGNANTASKMSDRVLNTLLELVIKDEEQEWFYKYKHFSKFPIRFSDNSIFSNKILITSKICWRCCDSSSRFTKCKSMSQWMFSILIFLNLAWSVLQIQQKIENYIVIYSDRFTVIWRRIVFLVVSMWSNFHVNILSGSEIMARFEKTRRSSLASGNRTE